RVVLGHGGGGVLSGELIEHLFLPALGDATNAEMRDSAVLDTPRTGRLAFTTDSYVVSPLFFPGGCIGDLAVNGTVNDLAMSGAQPLALSAGFIVEEGLEMAVLGRVATALGAAARAAGVPVVTGDTKVVDRGKADRLFVNTAGIGVVPDGVDVRPARATPGDVVLVSGHVGEHGVAVLSLREGIEFGTTLTSDTAALHSLVAALLAAVDDVHVMRDPTRGGVGGTLCEIAEVAGVGIELDERAVPVPDGVAAACGFLGLDPLHVANEGKMVAIVPAEDADAALAAMQSHRHGTHAAIIGTVVADHPGILVARSPLGAGRVVSRPLGEQLPRIC
ncbi:MAG: hydrogenase expression/formation protein HypE, partial [Micrococcales bacterium]|nr:hydrogenase expression/formation protein HypE [Micrococcales bacterium]